MRIPTIIALTLFLTQSQAPKGVIEGRVIRAGTREPISNVLITLMAPIPANATSNLAPDVATRLSNQINDITESGMRTGLAQDAIDNNIENVRRNAIAGTTRPVTAMTDGSGRFSFRDLAPGRYTVRAELDGYFAAPLNGSAPAALTKTINVQEGKANPARRSGNGKGLSRRWSYTRSQRSADFRHERGGVPCDIPQWAKDVVDLQSEIHRRSWGIPHLLDVPG